MDLFCEPNDPIPIADNKTPFVCIETWDGGLFRTYGHRKGRTSITPNMLRLIPDIPPAEQPYLENLYPTPKDVLQPFLQTWLYFGMLAEMLSLNEVAPGVRLMDKESAMAEISELYKKLTRSEDGETVLVAGEILKWRPLFRERLDLAPNKFERMVYLCSCLQYSMVLLHSTENIDHNVRYSIAALGELFSTGIYAAASLAQPKIELPIMGYFWHRDYIKEGSVVEDRMLKNGWCLSEVEKVRSQVQGLYTMHYTSLLKKTEPWLNHSNCSRSVCNAFQLDIASYEPAHVDKACGCAMIEAPAGQVSGILRDSDTYPVIRIQGFSSGNLDDLEIFVEEYRPGVSYVALSHVWANGLGNPSSNALPRCQIARIANLVARLPPEPGTTEAPRLWLDTLCCPVELGTKMISLERIADVYRKSYHVLVLDTSLTAFRHEGTHPAELLVRAFGCSPWMRRLWTLQEGALGRALQIQFADRAANNMALLTELFVIAGQDVRYMRIWQDVTNEFNQLLGFSPKTGPENTIVWTRPQITTLQRSLHFRTVSVPSDEPLCISTLMNLDTKYIAAGQDAEHRMIRVWEKLAESHGGISTRLLFYLDEPIDIPGWRWAPKSLLASAVQDSVLSLDDRVMRFHNEYRDSKSIRCLGIPTPLGLKVRLAGFRVVPNPFFPELPLHPWPEVINPTEDQVLMQAEATGQWYRIIDWYRSKKLPVWTREERLAYDRMENRPICRAIDTGKCAIILDQKLEMLGDTTACCLVQVEEASPAQLQAVGYSDSEGQAPLKARRERTVIMSKLTEAEGKMMNMVRGLAKTVAQDESTAEFLKAQKRSAPGNTDWDAAEGKVREKMKEVMAEAWQAHPDMQQTMRDTVGESLDDYVWVMIPKWFSHGVGMRDLGEQVWYVD
ncbi:hypothetical protein QQS21_007566 [Conoideocrella luteorostrata]|uniref:Heterokaryon incompatibility domain-containing protein n=1 Tax=Conoideocrella luteorostrata TaxID=1105319 RepID=A0AAJ0FRY2_9HYPO|nr:hypothetical protein QQS21_007566 [Conoideocrella luteorostrata]